MRSLSESEIQNLREEYSIAGHKLLVITNGVEINSVAKPMYDRHPIIDNQITFSGGRRFYTNIRVCHFSLWTDEEDFCWMEVFTSTEQVASDLAKKFDGSVRGGVNANTYYIEKLPNNVSVYDMILYLKHFDDLIVTYDVLSFKISTNY